MKHISRQRLSCQPHGIFGDSTSTGHWGNLASQVSSSDNVSMSVSADNGYYFPYGKRQREKRDTAVSLIQGGGNDGSSDGGGAVAGGGGRRKKDPVLLLPWWKEILGTIIFCIATTTYIVRKFFHPPTPVAYARVG